MADKKVLIIGDVHGKLGGYFDILDEFVMNNEGELYSLQVGDFGFKEEYRKRARWFDKSDRYDIDHHVFFGGNHDEYPIPDWAGHLGHYGEVPFIENSFFVRGAKSIDREARIAGRDWWPEEELDWKQSREALNQYIEMEPKHVFSHDAPQFVPTQMFVGENYNMETSTGNLLQEMFKFHKPETWTFGHWHKTESITIKGTEFRCLGELESTRHE